MGKSIDDTVLDAALDVIAACDKLTITSDTSTPTDITTNPLAQATDLVPGDYTIENGAVSGRKIIVPARTDMNVDVGGTAKHIVLSNGSDIKLITTCDDQVLVQDSKVSTPTFSDEIADPTV